VNRLLRAEWTKFRTVPGWVLAMAVAALVILGLGLFPGMTGTCGPGCGLPLGPDGEPVTDTFYFLHQPLTGDGSITVRVASLTGQLPPEARGPEAGGRARDGLARDGLAPWAKAGLVIKADTRPGSAYAAVMVTGAHGVRMQYDYTHDVAGPAGTVPRWLRLTRTGDTVTGYASADGTRWETVGSARLAGLASTVPAGLFAASPQYVEAVGVAAAAGGPTRVTAGFDHLDRQGGWAGAAWTGERIGGPDNAPERGGHQQTGTGFAVTGSGDIAPAVAGAAGLGTTITQTLVGTFAGLIVVVVVGALSVTAEYRRGLIRTTLAAGPRRGSVLAAKAAVLGAVSLVTGLVAAATVVILGQRVLRAHGVYVLPAGALTQARVVAGTAALLAVAAVLAVALGALLRRGAAAVAAVVVATVLPYLLAVSVLPPGPAQWLLRVTPAAAFAVQQTTPRYPQVDNLYTPVDGYFPLPPWAGFGVLCAWAAVALGVAVLLIRRRDA
jgi:hypothetical protein